MALAKEKFIRVTNDQLKLYKKYKAALDSLAPPDPEFKDNPEAIANAIVDSMHNAMMRHTLMQLRLEMYVVAFDDISSKYIQLLPDGPEKFAMATLMRLLESVQGGFSGSEVHERQKPGSMPRRGRGHNSKRDTRRTGEGIPKEQPGHVREGSDSVVHPRTEAKHSVRGNGKASGRPVRDKA